MGGNGSYSKSLGKVLDSSKTHIETGTRVDGHKVLLQDKNIHQVKVPMNSNSDNPIYLCAKVNKKTGSIEIDSIAIYDNHRIVGVIDLAKGKNSAHYHKWEESSDGDLGRKRHESSNTFPVPDKYKQLLKNVINYNKEGHQWKGK